MYDKLQTFPADFRWGAATASYQIEGSPLADGAGASIWHRFAHTYGTIARGENGDIACDSYRRWSEDVDLLKELNLNAYRFSLAWGRILPDGTGRVNDAGLDHYSRFVDALLDAGIQPFVTLYHWDLPAALQDRGGWPSRDIAGWFGEYAALVFDRLGDRVKDWITLNEPVVTTNLGYLNGTHAPGQKDLYAALRAQHHQLLAHGTAVQALRARWSDARVGLANALIPVLPATDSDADRAAAELHWAHHNAAYLDPIYGRGYPQLARDHFGPAWPAEQPDDAALIAQPTDFLGVNYYSRNRVAAAPGQGPFGFRTLDPEPPLTEMGWGIDAPGLHDVLIRLHQEYAPPVVHITENGAAFADLPDAAGVVDDGARLEYIARHLREIRRAVEAGAPVRGYFVWTLLDNFEWSLGFKPRFGLVRVDPEDQRRTIKRSGRWYAEVAASDGGNL